MRLHPVSEPPIRVRLQNRLRGEEHHQPHHHHCPFERRAFESRVDLRREQLEQLADYAASPVFNAAERAVIRYAEEATRNVRVSELTFDALRDFLDNRRIMELVMNVAFYNAVVRVLVPCGVELEEGAKKG